VSCQYDLMGRVRKPKPWSVYAAGISVEARLKLQPSGLESLTNLATWRREPSSCATCSRQKACWIPPSPGATPVCWRRSVDRSFQASVVERFVHARRHLEHKAGPGGLNPGLMWWRWGRVELPAWRSSLSAAVRQWRYLQPFALSACCHHSSHVAWVGVRIGVILLASRS
jgi:hypothetical protein